ncbi:MAG: flagellar hook-basal body protein [Campylobacterota bacterium]|nr:flagellar hook-basal body protein [Campylobacterota bacterium]
MTQGTYPLAANMINQLNRVDRISNNLANVNTAGFKEEHLAEGSFNRYLEETKKDKKEINELSYVMNTIPKIDNNYINSTLGSVEQTGNKLDFALSQFDSFFKVEKPNGDIELTRDGQFKIINGQLTTQNGYKVLNNDNQPINLEEEDFVQNISVVNSNYNNIKKVGNNNYEIIDETKIKLAENPQGQLLQGAVEKSNVNGVHSMVSLIDAQRRFEQAQKAVTSIDEINKKVIADVGSVR